MPRGTRSAVAVLLLLALAVPAVAQGPGKAREKRERKEEKREVKEEKQEAKEIRRIGEDERRLLRDYYATHRFEVRPLPPGIARNLAIGKPLPPGIRKRYLAEPVLARLPVYPGYSRYIIGGDVVLVNSSGVVVDIAVNIFR
jgi:hypothetical protein